MCTNLSIWNSDNYFLKSAIEKLLWSITSLLRVANHFALFDMQNEYPYLQIKKKSANVELEDILKSVGRMKSRVSFIIILKRNKIDQGR